ncbi:MAG: D-glycero-beta-D-manno-heptose 1-phosphate adenylyltransferase [Betaproteobacteria bacterium]|nr:D-glycero-beta-D-manno-heptose 1-phosphate adenylyltransferase [Betaproteobacteria bacterium]
MPPPSFLSKIATAANLPACLAALPRPLVFTNGCFDILHRGHVTYLDQARGLGAALVVGVNTDASVRRQGKGEDRPLNVLEDRLAVLAALAAVDLVVPFDQDTPLEIIRACRPEVLVKGGDWPVERIVGGPEVLARGGRVVSIPFQVDRSTTSLVSRIRQKSTPA